ncbi:MAG: Crp/Fnr family transcriptional regulator [Motiliproteus sp.]|nr:Crp/Fnr family transcriptional regulator [Motiliproteus sp.]MCW9051957.1 Crp/Fnr family transcriptional regulator [Motiliproteus sp.]
MDINQEVERLSQIPMFSKMETSKLKLLAFTSKLIEYQDGETLFHIDDPADSVYLVMAGYVEILVDSGSDIESTIVRGENALIGEMAVISKQGRTASVRAKGQVSVLRMEDDVFLKLLTGNPDVALDVMRQLSDKLTEAHQANELLQRQIKALKAD